MTLRTVLHTFVSRFLILILNFGVIIFTTNMWGSEGKGVISLLIADLAIVCFFSNVLVGSSISYFASRIKQEKLLLLSYAWSVIISIVVPYCVTYSHSQEHLWYLMAISLAFSLLTANINLFVGQQKISLFNIYTILQQVVLIGVLLLFIFIFKQKSIETYFLCQLLTYIILFATSTYSLLKDCSIRLFTFSKEAFIDMFHYGWKNQLSAFMQFLNNRLSYYFLSNIQGLSSVGIYSIGVAFSEAIWTISRSLAVILYSEIVNTDEETDTIERTKFSLKICFILSVISIGLMLCIPDWIYTKIFGKDFSETKSIIYFLSPGILAISVSNIIGHYFSGTNQLRILNVKSLVGLAFTVLLSIILIPKFGITGACIATTISYLISSGILFWKFYSTTNFSFSDYGISKKEILILMQNLKKSK